MTEDPRLGGTVADSNPGSAGTAYNWCVGERTLGTWLVLLVAAGGCYGSSRATRDVNASWRGHSRADIEARWGAPASSSTDGGVTTLVWSYTTRHITLPSARGHLVVDGDSFEAEAELRPGAITEHTTNLIARIDGSGRVLSVEGPSLRWGAPRGLNARWGLVMGAHGGMGRLDDTETPLPGGGLYIGGMLGPRLALVGSFGLFAGTGDDGAAMGFVWGLATQYWPMARVNLRLGPAAVLAFDAGFEDLGLEPGLTGAASFAIVRSGKFVVDLRFDVVQGTSTTLGTIGFGLNRN